MPDDARDLMTWKGGLAAGFARASITEGWKHPRPGMTMPDYAVHDDLWATAFVVTHKSVAVFAFVSLDMGTVNKPASDQVRRVVAAKTSIPFERILLHSTHSHATWSGFDASPDWFGGRIAAAVNEAAKQAQPADVRHGHVELGPGFNFNRRIRLSDGLGAHCVMFNTDCRTEGGRVEASAQLAKTVRDWEADWGALEMSRRENWCEGPIDSHAHVTLFGNPRGGWLGSIVRFAGHPVIVSRAWVGRTLSRDAVGHVTDHFQQLWKAPCLYVTGPSGNQRLYCEEYTFGESKKRGQLIAERAFRGLPFDSWDLDAFAFASRDVELDLWPGFPKDRAEQERKLAALAAEVKAAVAAKRPPAEIKRLAEAHQRMKFVGQMFDRPLLTMDEAAAGRFRQPVAAFDLGPAAFVTFPCEPFCEVSEALRREFGDRVVTAQLVGGSHGYVPTAEECALGGYEATWCSTAPGAAEKYVESAAHMLRDIRATGVFDEQERNVERLERLIRDAQTRKE